MNLFEVEVFTREMGNYIQTYTHTPRINWDAALTLGCCILVACRAASTPIQYVYSRLKSRQSNLLGVVENVLLGCGLTVFFVAGIISVMLSLGIIGGKTLQAFGVPQGIQREWTMTGLTSKTNLGDAK